MSTERYVVSVSSFPMVGYRNMRAATACSNGERIKLSDGGVSERLDGALAYNVRAYQAFRWWGIGT